MGPRLKVVHIDYCMARRSRDYRVYISLEKKGSKSFPRY